jgi:hypothetical protein
VQNERRGKGSFDKNENFGSGEPVQNERREKGSFHKMKTWLRRTCAE